ncbi:MAG: excalibur calcium-binding domain-containing protein [Candidatus Competibacteraceae bacterium]|nr:excalibur calcium-binding domain-containing protein [Candidatus Competibacteraceae bacterium]
MQNTSTDLANEQRVKCITKTGSVIYGTVPQGTICEKLEPIEGSLTVISSETRTERESRYNSDRQNSGISSFRCDGRVYCSQMTSRAEAEFFIRNCPNTKMDGDRDGIPCENDSRF